ncbi:CPBP family intramembrane glutamic endopeptidase [Naasia aerilata]|uniref:CAAX prenyl protease 2/Lysostaphin resistance protein A-like domain-containing protein n=1 Tax=Naasia aerilata TaxID=1162966 RepID=A0ABN6XPI0_9MICO|nr:CPBP family intramembrane glutamic endopeptidase [Naasia aerilata]BDZ46761.1 hypothetical protein GCM10025866_26700 [Naasia aerilata]
MAVAPLAGLLLPQDGAVSDLLRVAGPALIYVLLIAGIAVLGRRRGLGSLSSDFGLRIRPVDLLLGLGAAVVYELALILVGLALSGATDDRPTSNLTVFDSVALQAAFSVVVVVVGPLAEELLMRGLVLRALRNAILRRSGGGPPTEGRRRAAIDISVIGSALVFALLHLHEAHDLVTAVALFSATLLLGLITGWLASRTGRLGPGIVTHALVNGLALTLALSV